MMKKLTGLLAAVTLMASGVATAANTPSVTQTIDASVAATISITINNATASPALVPGTTTTMPATLTVNASQPYTITAAADTDSAKGTNADKLFEWSSNAYVASGAFVNASVQVGTVTGGTAAGTPVAATDITTGGVTIFTGTQAESGATINTSTSVATPWGTAALPTAGGHTYHMVITYTATTTSV